MEALITDVPGKASCEAESLSAILEAGAPVVELDAERLNTAISWIYDAVMTLQQQCSTMNTQIGRLEGATASGGKSEDSGAEVHRQVMDLHAAHTEIHHQLLQTSSRIAQIEKHPVILSRELNFGGDANWKGDIEGQITQQKAAHTRLNQDMTASAKKHDELKDTLLQLQQQLHQSRRTEDILSSFMSGVNNIGASKVGEDGPNSAQEDRIKASEKGILSMVRSGKTIESRLAEIEMNSGGKVLARLQAAEDNLRKLNIDELNQVQPALVVHRKEQHIFNEDMHRELQELKCLVGCLEACVPQETRKAIALFKRAVGADGVAASNAPESPMELELEGKILILREEMENKLRAAEATIADQCEHVNTIVRGLERKQEMLDGKFDDFRCAKVPAAAESRPGSDQTSRSADGGAAARGISSGSQVKLKGLPPGWEQKAKASS